MYQLDVDSLGVQYKHFSGEGVMCLCEFHNDHHPSMFVNLVEGNYYCFACGARGLIKDITNKTGGIIKFVPYNIVNNNNKDNDEWLQLLSYPVACDDAYLIERGFNNEIIEKWDVRSDEKRVIIPLKENNKVVGVKVRIKSAKKSVKYLTFGIQPTFVSNFDVFSGSEQVVITEGLFGLMRYDMHNIKCVTPLSITRAVNLKKLIENTKHKYYVAFDNDIAGLIGTSKLLFVCNALMNQPFAFLNLFDVDEVLVTKDIFDKSTTNSFSYHINQIKEYYGDKIYKEENDKFVKFIRTYRG